MFFCLKHIFILLYYQDQALPLIYWKLDSFYFLISRDNIVYYVPLLWIAVAGWIKNCYLKTNLHIFYFVVAQSEYYHVRVINIPVLNTHLHLLQQCVLWWYRLWSSFFRQMSQKFSLKSCAPKMNYLSVVLHRVMRLM